MIVLVLVGWLSVAALSLDPSSGADAVLERLRWAAPWTAAASEPWAPGPQRRLLCCSCLGSGVKTPDLVGLDLGSTAALEGTALRWTYAPARQRLVVYLRTYASPPLLKDPVCLAPGVFVDDLSWIVDPHADPRLGMDARQGPVEVALLSRGSRLVLWIEGERVADVEAEVSRRGYVHVVNASGDGRVPFDCSAIEVLARPRDLPWPLAGALATSLAWARWTAGG